MSPDRPDPASNDTDEGQPRPQFATVQDAVITSVDWLVEPSWKGERVLARLEGGRVSLTDEQGETPAEGLGDAAEVLAAALDAEQAVIDGVWTAMPFVGEGSAARRWAETIAEEGLAESEAAPDPIELESRRAFVAWDLLELDGKLLHDIPYQERRRLLGSVVQESIRVRVTPAVRPPFHRWIAAWHSNGFTHYVAKHVNSRYEPGETSPDWLQISTTPETGPAMIGSLVGQRTKKGPQILE
jgi:bifunctional non-homologous end joining protein LigD